jgi:hypothetical protein
MRSCSTLDEPAANLPDHGGISGWNFTLEFRLAKGLWRARFGAVLVLSSFSTRSATGQGSDEPAI